MDRLARGLMALAVVALIGATAIRSTAVWRTDGNLDHVAGAWMGLAYDLADGVFYRPLLSESGYGGTRFFPLYFSIHGGLIALGADPRIAGYAMSAASMLLLMAGVWFLLRGLGVGSGLAAFGTAAVLASASAQLALTTIRGDALPAALTVWGVGVCVRGMTDSRRIPAAALLFTLAFAAKVTAVFGAAAGILFFLVSGRSRSAARLFLATAAGVLLVLAGMSLASDGRVFGIMKACASGGATAGSIIKSPWNILYFLVYDDPAALPFFLLGAAAYLAMPGGTRASLPGIYYAAAAVTTLFIFGSPGTNINHLLDIHVASIVLLCTRISSAEPRVAAYPAAAMAIAAFVALRSITLGFPYADMDSRGEEYRQVLRFIGRSGKPILAENPMVPIAGGRRPYVLDPFMLRLVRLRDPSATSRLFDELSRKRFAAVVLQSDPTTAYGRKQLSRTHFGDGFLRKVLENYRFAGHIGYQFIFLPETGLAGSAEPADSRTRRSRSAVRPISKRR